LNLYRVKDFLNFSQTGSGVHPKVPQGVLRDLSLGEMQPGHDADHAPPSIVEIKKMWIYTSTSAYVFMVKCLIS
jgi:hypothetical protein